MASQNTICSPWCIGFMDGIAEHSAKLSVVSSFPCLVSLPHAIHYTSRAYIYINTFPLCIGFMVGKQYEAEGIGKHGAKLVSSFPFWFSPLHAIRYTSGAHTHIYINMFSCVYRIYSWPAI